MRRREFYERVQTLFQSANRRIWEPYEETLFSVRRPFTHSSYWHVRRFIGGNPPQSALADHRVHKDLDRILGRAKYPDAGPLGRLEDFTEEQTEFASALLHFNNPAYPIFDEPSVRGLNHLGTVLTFPPAIDTGAVDAYQIFIDGIQELKDEIPFQCVPEKNYYLARIIQESLWELGREAPMAPAPRKAPSRR